MSRRHDSRRFALFGLASILAVMLCDTPQASPRIAAALHGRSPSYTYKLIFFRRGKHVVTLPDNLKVGVLERAGGQAFELSENGHVAFVAQTNKGEALFRDAVPLAYKGKTISGLTVLDDPYFDDISRSGDVLYHFSYRPAAGSLALAVALNGSVVFKPDADLGSANPPPSGQRNREMRDGAGFLPDDRYSIPILVDIWRPYEGRLQYERTVPKWDIGGTVSDSGTIIDSYIDRDMRAKPPLSGIYIDELLGRYFHQKSLLGHADIASYRGVVRHNRQGQYAILISPSLANYGGTWVGSAFDLGQALILATPVGAATPPESKPPTLLELANLSNNVYEGKTGFRRFRWVGDNCKVPPNTCMNVGLAAAVYANEDASQVVVAIRGTVSSACTADEVAEMISTWHSDLSFSGYNVVVNMESDVRDAAAFIRQIQAQYPRANLTLTGHSLGGAIAQLEGEAGHITTVAFNAPGGQAIYDSVRKQIGTFRQSNSAHYANVNYRIKGDFLSEWGEPVGRTITLSKIVPPNGLIPQACQQSLSVHSIKTMIFRLQHAVP